MKKLLKRLLSVLLAVTVVIGSAPLSGLVGLELPDWVALDASAQISEDLADNDLVADYTELNKLREEAAAIDRTAYTDDSLDALDAVLEKITDDKKISEQDIVDGWADELEAALAGLTRDVSKAKANVQIVLNKASVAKDDVITVTVKLTTNYYVAGVQLPILYDKTLFELVGNEGGESYLTFDPDSSFAKGHYDFSGNSGLTNGFKYTSDAAKWNTDEAKAQYDYAWIAASANASAPGFQLVMPKDDIFVSFQVKALADVEDTTETIFISPDWTKTDDVRKGTFVIGYSDTEANTNALTYVTTGMTYTVETISHTEGKAVVENNVAPDCVNTGSYDTVVYCTVCGDEVSRETTVVDALGHTEGKWVVTKEAEVGVAGEETLYCAVCGDVIDTREIPAMRAYFKAAEGSNIVVDKERGIIYGLEEFFYDLEDYVDYEGGEVEYEYFGTGTVVNFIVDGEVYESYTVVIFGDLYGDGVVDLFDYSVLTAIINGDIEVEEGTPLYLAADVNADSVVDGYDLSVISAYINGDTVISQVPPEDGCVKVEGKEANTKVQIVLDKNNVIAGDIVTVKVKLDANYFTPVIQLPVIFDKTQFELVGPGESAVTLNADSAFANGTYNMLVNTEDEGFKYTSEPDKWNTEAAKAKYTSVLTTIYAAPTWDNDVDFELVMPEEDVVITFQIKAIDDVEDATQSIFISPDWIKTDEVRNGKFTVGYAEKATETDALKYASTGMTYEVETIAVVSAEDIVLDYTSVILSKAESTVQLKATVLPENSADKSVIWTSNDETVVKVNDNGLVTRIGEGSAIITATNSAGQQATCVITVIHECDSQTVAIIESVEPDCYNTGNIEHFKCKCGKLYLDEDATTETNSEDIIIPALDHPAEYVSKTDRVEPTHTTNGNIEYWTCYLCGDKFADEACETKASNVVLPSLGHDDINAIEWEKDEISHFRTCSCGQILVSEHHDFEWITDKSATCISTGIKHEECTVCGYVRNAGTVIVVPHNTQKYASVEPTCTAVGNIEYYVCRDCGKCFADSECTEEISMFAAMLPAKGHLYSEWMIDKDASCTVTGIKHRVCAVCSDVETETVVAEGHSLVKHESNSATCTENGNIEYYHCSNCSKNFADEMCETEVDSIVIPSTGHADGEAVEKNRNEATCTEDGSYDIVVYCTVCGEELSRETIILNAHGHTDGEAVEENRNEATCTEDDSYDIVIYCTVCGEETLREFHIIDAKGHDDVTLQEWSNDNETHYKECSCGERVDSTNHTFKWVIDKNSTCTSTGLKHEECDICGFIRNDNTVVEKTPHMTIKFDRVEPTCQEEGNIEYYFCSSCAKYYSDSECTNMIKVSQVGLEKIDHVYGDWVVETEPSCDKQGFRYKQCISCDEMITETIEKTDHSYTENVIVPTCTKSGYTQLTCDVCGDSDIKDFVEPLGHKYTSVVTPPTATEDGYTTYTCERCDDTYKDDFISPGTGLTVTGTVVSFGSEFDYITINLISADTGEILYTTSVLGNSAVYAFNAVLPGGYIIDASKNNHSDRTYKITVKNEDVTQDAKIHLIGDINGDGKVNTIDVARANAQARSVSVLLDYEFACADINGDGKVNTIDVARVNAHARGVTTLW